MSKPEPKSRKISRNIQFSLIATAQTTDSNHDNIHLNHDTKKNSQDDNKIINPATKIGTAKKRHEKVDTQKIQQVGKRARDILEQERHKRKEIVRLQQDEEGKIQHSLNIKQSSSKPTAKSNTACIQPKPSKRIRTIQSNQNVSTEDTNYQNKQDLLCDSDIVRLSHLPDETKIEHINSFFQGLNPQYIYILPSLNRTIHELDDIPSPIRDPSYNKHLRQMPSSSSPKATNYLRVYIQFKSKSIAFNAVSRSGESINIMHRSTKSKNENNTTHSYPITVTSVSYQLSNYLQRNNIAIILPCSKHFSAYNTIFGDGTVIGRWNQTTHEKIHSLPLEIISHQTQQFMPTIVNSILWFMIQVKTRLLVNIHHIGGRAVESDHGVQGYDAIIQNQTSTSSWMKLTDLECTFPLVHLSKMYNLAYNYNVGDDDHQTTEIYDIITSYNQLWDIHEVLWNHATSLEYSIDTIRSDVNRDGTDSDSIPSINGNDAVLAFCMCHAHHLTTVACDWIVDLLKSIQRCILHKEKSHEIFMLK